jgi:hypothetical protein
VCAGVAPVYPVSVYLDSVRDISVASAGCFNEADRVRLISLVEDNYTSIAEFERFAKLCAFAMLGYNIKINVEFNIDNMGEVSTSRRA